MSGDHQPAYRAEGKLGLLPGLRVFGVLRAVEKKERDQDRPGAVLHTKRSSASASQAMRIAHQGREDETAVRELSQAAGRHRGELRRAATSIRFQGWANDSEVHDRASRLLLAAADRRAVQPLTPERADWFRTLRSLQYGAHESGYEFLAARQPALRDLEADVMAEAAPAAGQRDASTPEERTWALWEQFGERLAALVGIEAKDEPEPILGTRTALMVADRHLTVAFGLPDPAEAELEEAKQDPLAHDRPDEPLT